ncbi:MAG: hypothetical protein J6T57_03015 [Alphaproteobacteria bacterium]|nr:hypothetical protein [Alphaproteobacteria bacterium]
MPDKKTPDLQNTTPEIPNEISIALSTVQDILRKEMSDAEKRFSAELEKSGLGNKFIKQYMITLRNPEAESRFAQDKNSYGFWGPDTQKLVKTPETLWMPTSFEAFKATGLREIYDNYTVDTKPGIDESVDAAIAIEDWAYKNKLDEFFLKNATFSAKHRWPLTCNVDYTFLPEQTRDSRVAHTLRHMNNINSYALLVHTTPGLGWVARKKLDLEPLCYAFGTTIYEIINREDGTKKIFEYNGREDVREYMVGLQKSNPNFEISWRHVGMPITKEVRIFAIGGAVVGYVPYWTPTCFKNQSVYGVGENFSLESTIKKLNTIEKTDLEHVHAETEKILHHDKFRDTDWTVDWVKTRNGDWYMIDMQTAKGSFMDYDYMIFPTPASKTIVDRFLVARYQELNDCLRGVGPLQRALVTIMSGHRPNVEKRLSEYGYPNIQRLKQMQQNLLEK